MATNKPAGDRHRNGAVRDRSQLSTKMMGEEHATKRDTTTGEFMAVKKDGEKFKGVRQQKMSPREKTGNGTEPPLKESTEPPVVNDPSTEAEPGATIMPPAD